MLKSLFSGALVRTLSLLFLLTSTTLCPTLTAQDRTAGQPSEEPSAEPSAELTKDDSILLELRTIRGLQQEAQLRREKIRAEMEKRDAGQKDSAALVMSDEYGAILQVENNTRPNWYYDDWNVYGISTFALACIAFCVSVFSFWFTRKTFFAQKNTELHTTNAPIDVQLSTLEDLPRHFYRNLVCTCAMILKFKFGEKKGEVYPSEGNMRKLQTLPDDVVLPIDVDTDKEDNAYQHMHELRLLLRNYNVEVQVASEHVARKGIMEETLAQDFGNLLYKPLFLTMRTFDFKKSLKKKGLTEGYEVDFVLDAFSKMIQEHFRKLYMPSNFKCLFKKGTIEYLSIIMPEGKVNLGMFDKGGDIQRSVKVLLDYASKKSGELVKTIKRDVPINVLIKENQQQKKEDITPYFRGAEATNQKPDHPGILAIKDAEEFTKFCICADYIKPDEEEKVAAATLYPHLAPYLNYLHNPVWDTTTILQFILAIDAAIETNRIGMVNYLTTHQAG